MHTAAANGLRVFGWLVRLHDGDLARIVAKGLLVVFLSAAHQLIQNKNRQFVVGKICSLAKRALFENHHVESLRRQLFRDDAAGRPGADDDKIHFLVVAKRRLRVIRHGVLPEPVLS